MIDRILRHFDGQTRHPEGEARRIATSSLLISQNRAVIVLWAMMMVYLAWFFCSAILGYFSFSNTDFDLATYDQIVWNITRGVRYNSVLGVDFLGHHAHFLAFPIAFIYKFAPHPLTLQFLQTLAIAWGAYPLFLIARQYLNASWGLVVAAAYLLYPGTGYTNAFEFHFTPFATLSLLYMFYYFFTQKYFGFALALVLTLLCQENLALAVIMFGVYAFLLKRSARWWLPALIIGTAYFLFYVKVVVPHLNPDTIKFISIYGRWGHDYGEIIRNLFGHPVEVFRYLTEPERLYWIFQLFSPLLFIPWFEPIHLLPSLPLFFQHLFSSRHSEITLIYHYTAELIPFIFIAFIFGIKHVMSVGLFKKNERTFMIAVFALSITAMCWMGPHLTLYRKSIVTPDHLDRVKADLVSLIPEDAALVTTFELMSHTNHRANLYSFHHISWGYFTLSDQPYVLPGPVNYALLDMTDGLTFGSFYSPERYSNIQNFLIKYSLLPVVYRDNLVLFRKTAVPVSLQSYKALFTVSQEAQPVFKEYFSNGDVALEQVSVHSQKGVLALELSWQSLRATNQEISPFFDFVNEKGVLVARLFSPTCYRIYPTQAWRKGEWVRDRKYLTVPFALRGKTYLLNVGLYNEGQRKIIAALGSFKIEGN